MVPSKSKKPFIIRKDENCWYNLKFIYSARLLHDYKVSNRSRFSNFLIVWRGGIKNDNLYHTFGYYRCACIESWSSNRLYISNMRFLSWVAAYLSFLSVDRVAVATVANNGNNTSSNNKWRKPAEKQFRWNDPESPSHLPTTVSSAYWKVIGKKDVD